MGVFDAFQIPYSAVEREHEEAITSAAHAGGGTIIRGGVARGLPEPSPDYPERFKEMIRARNERFEKTDVSDLLGDMTPMEFLLRFTISHPDMHTTIVGTKDPDHLAANVEAASRALCLPTSTQRRRPATSRELCYQSVSSRPPSTTIICPVT